MFPLTRKKMRKELLSLLKQKGGMLKPSDGNVIDHAWRGSGVDNSPRREFAKAVQYCVEQGQVEEIYDKDGRRIGLKLAS